MIEIRNRHFHLYEGMVYCFSEEIYEDFKRHGCRCQKRVLQQPEEENGDVSNNHRYAN